MYINPRVSVVFVVGPCYCGLSFLRTSPLLSRLVIRCLILVVRAVCEYVSRHTDCFMWALPLIISDQRQLHVISPSLFNALSFVSCLSDRCWSFPVLFLFEFSSCVPSTALSSLCQAVPISILLWITPDSSLTTPRKSSFCCHPSHLDCPSNSLCHHSPAGCNWKTFAVLSIKSYFTCNLHPRIFHITERSDHHYGCSKFCFTDWVHQPQYRSYGSAAWEYHHHGARCASARDAGVRALPEVPIPE